MQVRTRQDQVVEVLNGICATCRDRHPHRQPGVIARVEFWPEPDYVRYFQPRRMGRNHLGSALKPDGPRITWWSMKEQLAPERGNGRSGGSLQCTSCSAKPRIGKRKLRALATAAREQGRDHFYVAAS